MTDLVAALVIELKADTAVAALVSTRVFGVEVPEGEVVSMPRKSVVLRQAGGEPITDFRDIDKPRIDVFSFGETPYEARRVRRAVHDALKQLSRKVVAGVQDGDVLIHSIEQSSGPIDLRYGETNWPVVIESWEALHSEQAVT